MNLTRAFAFTALTVFPVGANAQDNFPYPPLDNEIKECITAQLQDRYPQLNMHYQQLHDEHFFKMQTPSTGITDTDVRLTGETPDSFEIFKFGDRVNMSGGSSLQYFQGVAGGTDNSYFSREPTIYDNSLSKDAQSSLKSELRHTRDAVERCFAAPLLIS